MVARQTHKAPSLRSLQVSCSGPSGPSGPSLRARPLPSSTSLAHYLPSSHIVLTQNRSKTLTQNRSKIGPVTGGFHSLSGNFKLPNGYRVYPKNSVLSKLKMNDRIFGLCLSLLHYLHPKSPILLLCKTNLLLLTSGIHSCLPMQ